ncbi:MAG: hypothetical protein FWH35_07890 [Treponema sp.]|nr:hypothetical protein [Treponema sp.]
MKEDPIITYDLGMDSNDNQRSELSSIHWHPAFVEAIQLELEEYRDSLEFCPECQLTDEPLRIDCIVIKKAKDVVIKKNIASIFREVNLAEYKSPDDYVSINDFYKVYAYACLYASLNNFPITSLTITFIESHYPRKLIKHLKEVRNYRVEENSHGIYTVIGDILPIQIIDSRKLSVDENLWLKNLSNRLDPLAVIKISDEVKRQDKTARIRAYMNVIAKSNFHAIEEAMNMSSPAKSLEEVLERTGFNARVEAKTEVRVMETAARNALAEGATPEFVQKITGLDMEKIKNIQAQQNTDYA